MVWSNNAVDKITVPASVPIGGTQDGVILSGADIPAELRTYGISAAIIFQRGNYPSKGATPEAKYFFIGISNAIDLVNRGVLSFGTVVDDKVGGLQVLPQVDLPLEYYQNSHGIWTGRYGDTFRFMDLHFGQGAHITESSIAAVNSTAHAGQTLNPSGWYNVALKSGWLPQSGNIVGVEFKLTSSGLVCLRAQVTVNTATPTSIPICNLGTNDNFKTFPDKGTPFVGYYWGAGTGTCEVILQPNGDLVIGGALSVPPNGANVQFSTSYYGQQ